MGFNIVKPNENMNEVDHINSVNTDNRLENLRWADRDIQINNPNTKVKRIMKIKYTKDGKETIYTKGIRLLSREIKISEPVIYKYIALKTEYKGYLFEMLDEELETRNTRKRNELLNIDKKTIQKVFKVKVIHNTEEKIFNSIHKASLYTKISWEIIKKHSVNKLEYKGYRFELLNNM